MANESNTSSTSSKGKNQSSRNVAETTRGEEKDTRSTTTMRRLTLFSEFDTRLSTMENEYGRRLSCEIRRNVDVSNGDEGQWIADVYFYTASGTKISRRIVTANYGDLHTQAIDSLRTMLRGHVEPLERQTARRA